MKQLIILSILFITVSLNAQFTMFSEPDEPLVDSMTTKERLVYGGFGGMNFSSNFFFLQLNPQMGYRITNHATAGVNLNVFLNQDSFYQYRYAAAGPSLFGRYRFLNILFVQSELEMLYIQRKFNHKLSNEITTQEFVPGVLLGGGITLNNGGKSYSSISVMWNIVDGDNRPYRNPQLRFGFHYGF